MAQAVFNDMAKKAGVDAAAFSRGLAADGSGISENARAVLLDMGLDASGHISKTVSRDDIESADYVIGISSRHAARLMAEFPEFCEKVYAFPFDVPDPFGGNKAVYENTLCEIKRGIELIIREVFGSD